MTLLCVSKLQKKYAVGDRETEVLRDVSFELDVGGTLALEGESGSGKSTVLHLIAGLDRPTSGSILLDGIEVASLSDPEGAALRRQKVGVIFQQFNLVPSLTVQANIAFHARLAEKHDAEWAAHLADAIGLSEHLAKYPEALSGGQQQRVAIARTLAARPSLILSDEPTGNLDEDTADRVLSLILDNARETNSAVLMVTHSLRLASAMGRRLVLSHGVVRERAVSETAARIP